MSKKNQFGTKIGLIAATVGSAIGLGNPPKRRLTEVQLSYLFISVVCFCSAYR